MKTDIITALVVGIITNGATWVLLIFIIRNMHNRIDKKTDRCLCRERHEIIDKSSDDIKDIVKDLYNKINAIDKKLTGIDVLMRQKNTADVTINE